MKALILDGSRSEDNVIIDINGKITNELCGKGWEVETIRLKDKKIATCIGCFGCWMKTPGQCILNDDGREVTRKLIQSDLVVLLTPVTFGGYSYEMKKAIDRMIPNILPTFKIINGEIHHNRRYDAYPRLIVIGTMPDNDDMMSGIFRKLVERNAINMNAPAMACEVVTQDCIDEGMINGLLKQTGVVA